MLLQLEKVWFRLTSATLVNGVQTADIVPGLTGQLDLNAFFKGA
jgi:hypothetical protein